MAATTRSRRRILIVDDDRALRHVLSALLIGVGHVVEQAGDGPEALAHLDAGGVRYRAARHRPARARAASTSWRTRDARQRRRS